jgi:predicted membrane protein
VFLFCLSSFCCVSYVASFSGLFLFCLSSSFLLYIVVSYTYCVVFCFVCLRLFLYLMLLVFKQNKNNAEKLAT